MSIEIGKFKKNMNIMNQLKFKLVMYDLYLLMFYSNLLQKHYVPEELLLILIESTFFLGWCIANIFSTLNRINMIYFIGVDPDIV